MAPTDPRILAIHKAATDYAENFTGESDVQSAARARAAEVGLPVVSVGVGSLLRVLAAATQASNVVEIGTGAGISALWFLDAMTEDGVFTSIDREAEYQVIAKDALAQADISHTRVRLIHGEPDEVIERLTPAAYDIVLINSNPEELSDHLERAWTLLRTGGLLLIHRALWQDKLPDPAQRDADTVAMRETVTSIRTNDEIISALAPLGDGLLIAVKR